MIVLLEGVNRKFSSLRRLEGGMLKKTIREIIVSLPRSNQFNKDADEKKLLERIVHVNGLIGGESSDTRQLFLLSLFARFAVPGFVVLLILMNFM